MAAPGGVGSPALGLDGLSVFFLLVVAVAAVPALLFARDAPRETPHRRLLDGLTVAFVLALLLVLVARDVVTFLAGWELMTLIPASAILVARREAPVRRAVFVYLAITHLGGVGVWVALLVLAHEWAIAGVAPAGGLQALVAVAALIGFGTKAGLMPLHAWLPRAHPVAPAQLSALMSGVMVKVALYGLIRVLFWWDGPVPRWVGLVLLALGLLSALGGILYALVQRELKRLLAFSTIEHVGIVALALGASLVLAAGDTDPGMWSALAFAAALLHVAGHAVAKALLFLGAGAFARGTGGGSLELDRLGGLLARMPWSGWAFLAGCAGIAGVVPFGVFVSEWLTLQALLHVAYEPVAGVALAGALAAAGLAATAALAVFCFVKVAGLVLLGAPRSDAAAAAVEQPRATRTALALLAGLTLAGGLAAGVLVPLLARLSPAGGAAVPGGVGLSLPSTGGLPVVGIVVALAALTVAVLRAIRGSRAAQRPAWACGQRVEPALAWTSAGFTKPLRLMLETGFRPRREVGTDVCHGVVRHVTHTAEVPHLFDAWLYAPVHRAALRGAMLARRLQSGSVRAYLAYLLGVLVLLLALARTGWIG
jgi:hydrogenase-4 component B